MDPETRARIEEQYADFLADLDANPPEDGYDCPLCRGAAVVYP